MKLRKVAIVKKSSLLFGDDEGWKLFVDILSGLDEFYIDTKDYGTTVEVFRLPVPPDYEDPIKPKTK